MYTYDRIETTADLPPEGPPTARTRERLDLDFKTFADARKHAEHAKDLAAFANALGGVILVGADHDGTTGELKYPGIAGQQLGDVQRIYDDAAGACSPSPDIDAIPMTAPNGKQLLAVNVNPQIHQIIASPVQHGWAFPMRVGGKTKFIRPEELAMYMDREVRRAFLLLSRIPEDAREEVEVSYHLPQNTAYGRAGMFLNSTRLTLGKLAIETNAATLEYSIADTIVQCRVPLRDVLEVWEQADGKWHVLVHGALDENRRQALLRYQLNPRVG